MEMQVSRPAELQISEKISFLLLFVSTVFQKKKKKSL